MLGAAVKFSLQCDMSALRYRALMSHPTSFGRPLKRNVRRVKRLACFACVLAILDGCVTITDATYWAPSGTGKVTDVGNGIPSIMKFSLDEKAEVQVFVEPVTSPRLYLYFYLGKQESARLDSSRIELVCDGLPPKYLTVDLIHRPGSP